MSRFARPYTHREKLPAVKTCQERDWTLGTRLRSSTWRADRQISGFDKNFLRTREVGGECHSSFRSLSLPPDVLAVVLVCDSCEVERQALGGADAGDQTACGKCEAGVLRVAVR